MNSMLKAGLIALSLVASSAASAATVLSTGGPATNDYVVTGINGISINGAYWNMTFGTAWDGVSMGEAFSVAASQALNGLFTGSGELQGSTFDSNPSGIVGCTLTLNDCNIFTVAGHSPVPGEVLYAYADNLTSIYDAQEVGLYGGVFSYSLSLINLENDVAITSWTAVEPSAVPIPAASFMFAPVLLGFMGLRRKAKNSVA